MQPFFIKEGNEKARIVDLEKVSDIEIDGGHIRLHTINRCIQMHHRPDVAERICYALFQSMRRGLPAPVRSGEESIGEFVKRKMEEGESVEREDQKACEVW